MSWGTAQGHQVPTASPGGSLPDSIPDLASWFDAADEATVDTTAGRVNSWTNKGPGGPAIASQPGANSLKPTVIVIGGLQGILFDGIDDFLTGTPATPTLTAGTIMAAIQPRADAPEMIFASIGDAIGGLDWQEFGLAAAGAGALYSVGDAANGDSRAIGQDPYVAGDAYVYSAVEELTRRKTSLALLGDPFVDATRASASMDTLNLGRSVPPRTPNYFNGVLGEIVSYSRTLDALEVADLYLYFRAKWSII